LSRFLHVILIHYIISLLFPKFLSWRFSIPYVKLKKKSLHQFFFKKKPLHQLLPIPCFSHVSSSLHEDSASLWMLTVVIMKHLHPNKILIPISVLPSQPSPIQRSSNRVCPSDSWKLQFLKDVFFRRFFVNEESSIWEIVSLRLSLRIVSQVTSWLFVNFQVSLINYQCFLVEDSSVLSRENVISISKGVKVHKSRD
jgi:hypothetical protein